MKEKTPTKLFEQLEGATDVIDIIPKTCMHYGVYLPVMQEEKQMTNELRLRNALELAVADNKFIGDTSKVNKAIEALTPKSTVSATFKRLHGNALRDFLEKKDAGRVDYTDQTRADQIKKYVTDKFQSYIDDPKTSEEATKLFNAAYPVVVVPPADGVADEELEAA